MNNTVVFITALPLEYQAVVAYLTECKEEAHSEGTLYEVGNYPGKNTCWRVAVVEIGQGNPNAAQATERAISHFNPSYAFFVGVAGGIKEVNLGDVVVAESVKGYHRSKATDKEVLPRGHGYLSDYRLVERAKAMVRKPDWLSKIQSEPREARAWVATIVAGEQVVASIRAEVYKFIKANYSEAVAVEMEGLGFLTTIKATPSVQGIVIRGISDLLTNKTATHDKEWQPIAARNAAAFAFAMLDELSPQSDKPDRSSRPVRFGESDKPDRSSRPVRFGENESVEETPIFTIPLSRNLRFVGRQDLLTQLHTTLATQRLVALCGLGGVGKTQVAVEYAYRHQQEYPAVLWLSLSSATEVHSRFATLAEGLGIPILQQKQEDLVAQVKHWLASHQDWLLLVDNADELDSLKSFMPLLPATVTGWVLFTTRQQQPPLPIRHVAMETLTVAAGAGFIVQQVYEVTEAEVVQHGEYLAAQALSQQLGGLPLALTQAAAYMRAHSCCCADYLDLYREHQQDLLAERGDILMADGHPDSVAITFEVSLKPLRTQQPQAIELLYCCAVLHPDGIPEEVLMTALAVNKLQLDKLLKPLLGYSLLTRHTGQKAVSIHKLVQAVLRLELGAALPQWIARLVAVVEKLFPETEGSMKQWAQVEHWQRCERLLASALACAEEIKHSHLATDTAARLLQRLADYLKRKADYDQSLQWYELALAIYEQVGGKERLETVSIRNSMVDVYFYKGDYDKALPLAKEALNICERVLGEEHTLTTENLNNLGGIYYAKGEYDKVLPLWERALEILEQVLGKEHPDTTNILSRLANIYQTKGEYEKALPLYQRDLDICERVLGKEHPYTANSLGNLAGLYQAQGEYDKALPLYERELVINERVLGTEHPNTANSLDNLAGLYQAQGEYDKALPLFKQVLAIRERVLGTEHPNTAISLSTLAGLYQAQGEYDKALPLFERALAICERVLGTEHPGTGASLNDLALLYNAKGEYEKALPLYQRTLEIWERVSGKEHPETAITIHNLAVVYRDQGDYDHALPLLERALAIRTQHLDPDHPRLAQSYHDLGIFYQRQGQHDQALSFLERALTIRERKLGPDHPDTARTRSELALVYQAQGQAEKATECYETALATLRTRLPHHPDTQRVAENYQTWQAGLKKKRRGKKG
jgi:tetratricopeptide (TPR) repeat protein/nucleoside phosphorylase